jgi:hypothetical protein
MLEPGNEFWNGWEMEDTLTMRNGSLDGGCFLEGCLAKDWQTIQDTYLIMI